MRKRHSHDDMERTPKNCLSKVARGTNSEDVWDLGKDGKAKNNIDYSSVWDLPVGELLYPRPPFSSPLGVE